NKSHGRTMSGQISKEDRQQLERWIGLGPRDFELLYSISRDGCSPEIFHKLCDNQGPTLTVLYNTHGSVFGGYASSSWTNPPKDTLVQDENAFLTEKKFPVKNSPKALKACATKGPGFGSNRDFATFDSHISKENGKFKLDGYMKTPQDWLDYGNKGVLSKGDIMNNDLHVTELEVYKSLEAQSELIGSLKPCKEQGVSDFRVLLLGPTGSGKSSFVNTVRSTFMGRLSQKAACGLGIPYNTVLTKIDEVCENTEDIYKCAAVGEVVEKVAVKLGVSRNTVFPVKNYENEVELDEHVGALALISLKHILYSAADASDAESAGETTESDVI
ncbi:IFI44-like protein, partial [Mya arenaria]